MKKVILCFFLFGIAIGFAQESENRILWQENRLLQWNDFKAEPNLGVPFYASTSSGISFSWSLRSFGGEEQFEYEIGSWFNPDLSWVKGANASDDLLAHEQLHFDISELYARKLRKALSGYKPGRAVKREIKAIYQRNELERQRLQERYDLESKHGLDREAEAKWQKEIKAQLENLKQFAA